MDIGRLDRLGGLIVPKTADNRVKQEKQDEIAHAVRDHERHCDQHWADMIWDLSMSLGLEEETVERIANEAVGS
jgi:hypothetical protein